MILWLDAQLSPALAPWLAETFAIDVHPVRDLGLRDANDRHIFDAARAAGAVVMSKDRDFVSLVTQHGAPPQIIWITCGNTSNDHLKSILHSAFAAAIEWLEQGEPLVQISERLEDSDSA